VGRTTGKRQRNTPEQTISKLREAEVNLAKEVAIAQVCKDFAITEQDVLYRIAWMTNH
jgi:hypothetical protein